MGLNGEWKKEKKKKLSHDRMTPQIPMEHPWDERYEERKTQWDGVFLAKDISPGQK
jgi:hypothetical protein